jgi:hypothetical protein
MIFVPRGTIRRKKNSTMEAGANPNPIPLKPNITDIKLVSTSLMIPMMPLMESGTIGPDRYNPRHAFYFDAGLE